MAKHDRVPGFVPKVEELEPREVPSATPWVGEAFDTTPAGQIPGGFASFVSGGAAVAASPMRALSAPQSLLASATGSQAVARVWRDAELPADMQAGASVFLNTQIPAQVFVRGTSLDTAAPTYYAASVSRGLQLRILRVVNGTTTVLAQLNSTNYLSNQWVRVTLSAAGNGLAAQVYRADTRTYLNPSGQWQSAPTWALSAQDSVITGGGRAGLARPASFAGAVAFDDFAAVVPGGTEGFDQTAVGTLPPGWAQFASAGPPAFAVSSARSLSPTRGLASVTGASNIAARAFLTSPQQADTQASAAVFLNSQAPAQVLVRGSGLDTSAPTYYAASVSRGLELRLVRVVNGVSTTLGQLQSASYLSNAWVRVTVYAQGTTLRAQVFRPDTGQYLNTAGQWQTEFAWALMTTDATVAGPGLVGLARPAHSVGTVTFDDFSFDTAEGDTQAPSVSITAPPDNATLTGVVTVRASAADNVGVTRVEVYLDGVLRAVDTQAPYEWVFDTSTVANGAHTLTVLAFDAAGNMGQATRAVTTQNDNVLVPPNIPRHYQHIRIAQLAYSGLPFSAFEDNLLMNSVDLVVANPSFLSRINGVAPDTPQLLYGNASNIYQELLTDYLAYADANGFSREVGFYHAARASSFAGNSSSSQPVTWFWGVYRGGATLTNVTSRARGTAAGGVTFGAAAGESVFVGYTEKFREINVNLTAAAGAGWAGVLEYVTAVDALGRPTAWAPLTTLGDTTAGLTTSGRITFDPPPDWVTASVSGSARLYYVRFRTTSGGAAPVAATILGRDYVLAMGGNSGFIPAFDATADANADGYLNDAEYVGRAAGKDARFVHESRLFHSNYGQMRFATNVSSLGFRDWLTDYYTRYLAARPLADGLFMDNSNGRVPFLAVDAQEPTASYANDLGAALNGLGRALAPRFVLVNTAGGGTSADDVVRQNVAYYEEFSIRPLAHTPAQFEEIAALVGRRSALRSPAPFAVLDSLPTNGSPTDPRTQLATLAYYYLVADPATTFLNFYGGFEPGTSWTRHWAPAAAFDVGAPQGAFRLRTTGADPANAQLTYRLYERDFGNALVLYKPLSSAPGRAPGGVGDATATTHQLGATYRPLGADGTLGAPVTSVTLRNGEGAVLVRV